MRLHGGLVTRKGNFDLRTFSLWELRDRPVRRCAPIPKSKYCARGGLVTSLSDMIIYMGSYVNSAVSYEDVWYTCSLIKSPAAYVAEQTVYNSIPFFLMLQFSTSHSCWLPEKWHLRDLLL